MPREALNLKEIPFKIVYETYRKTDGKENWELCMMNADGSEAENITNTPGIDEMYPHVSPDGTKICFSADEMDEKDKVRNVYYMNLDGSDRVRVATNGREPCWCIDSKSIAYLKGEYARYTTREYATAELMYYHLEGDWHTPHRNKELQHLYAICWSPDSKWFLAAIHGGMGYSDTILAFDAYGTRTIRSGEMGSQGVQARSQLRRHPDGLGRDGLEPAHRGHRPAIRRAQGHQYPGYPPVSPGTPKSITSISPRTASTSRSATAPSAAASRSGGWPRAGISAWAT